MNDVDYYDCCMKKWKRLIMAGVAVIATATVSLLFLASSGFFQTEIWDRQRPLVDPLQVTTVLEGGLVLVDGRVVRPAGVRRRESVAPADYDQAIRTMVSQGVVVTRDVDDGSAFLLVEPRFYNWCGTRGYGGKPWARWAGAYIQCPLSELLVYAGYAAPDLDQPGLTARERWRLEGAEHFGQPQKEPMKCLPSLNALRFAADLRHFDDYETSLETTWIPAPPSSPAP